MVIKYKAKYIRDGEVVIDDNALIELGSGDSNSSSSADGGRAKNNTAWESMVAESSERLKDVDSEDHPAADSEWAESASPDSGSMQKSSDSASNQK